MRPGRLAKYSLRRHDREKRHLKVHPYGMPATVDRDLAVQMDCARSIRSVGFHQLRAEALAQLTESQTV